jgi:glycosyltransferase involved in cell wall biosynthesis
MSVGPRITAARAPVVIIIGPPVDGRGGMSSVAAAYREQGLFASQNVLFVNTVGVAGLLGKLWFALQARWQFLGIWTHGPVRLVHIHISSGMSFWRKAVFVWTTRVLRIPLILHIHGGDFVEFHAKASMAGQWFIRHTFSCARRAIVLSTSWIARVAPFVATEACVAVGNPVVAWVMPLRESREMRRFLFLGRFEQDKGILELMHAFARVHGEFPQAKLMLGVPRRSEWIFGLSPLLVGGVRWSLRRLPE